MNLWNLKELNLLAGLMSEQVNQILNIVTAQQFRRGSFIFQPGDSDERFYLLHHGRVKTYIISKQGKEKIMHIFYPGDAFGSLMRGTQPGKQPWAQALDDVVVSFMDENAFKRFMLEFPDLCLNIFRFMAAHHAKDMRRLETLMHTNASQRLVLTLLDLGERLGHGEADSFVLDPSFMHEDLANMIGVVRSTVSELIGKLRRIGVLGGRGHNLTVYPRVAENYLQGDPP
ncbi:MAG: Crp/Fnr family transcriptional regulator [Anaerolineales bacterium]|jgi:CRP-like cAMP-binding protein